MGYPQEYMQLRPQPTASRAQFSSNGDVYSEDQDDIDTVEEGRKLNKRSPPAENEDEHMTRTTMKMLQTLLENENEHIQAEKNPYIRFCLSKQKCFIFYMVLFIMLVFLLSRLLVDEMLITNINSVLETYYYVTKNVTDS